MPLEPQQLQQLKLQYRQELRTVFRHVARREMPFEVSAPVALILENEPIKNCAVVPLEYRTKTWYMLVQKQLVYFVANAGEGNPKDADEAMDVISDFDECVKKYEKELAKKGETCVQQAYFTTQARKAYGVYCINKLVKTGKGRDEDGEPEPEFNKETIERLALDDKDVIDNLKGIAAIRLDKQASELKKYAPKEVLRHVRVVTDIEALTKEEFERVAQIVKNTVRCDCGSHFEYREMDTGERTLKQEYARNGPVEKQGDVQYEVYKDGDKYKGRKTIFLEESEIARAGENIEKLLKNIEAIRKKNGLKIRKHDNALIKQYINTVYLSAYRNPNVLLDVSPSKKV